MNDEDEAGSPLAAVTAAEVEGEVGRTAAPAGKVDDGPPGRGFWVGMGIGAVVVLFGVGGLFTADGSGLSSWIPWFAGGALLLDLAIVPLTAVIGALGRRLLPGWAWYPARAALVASATLTAFALPLVLHLGGNPDNPTVRPRHYGAGLATSLAAVWAVAAVALATSWAASRRRG